MNTYLLLPLVQTAVCLILIITVLKGHFSSFTNRLFALFLLCLSAWGIIIFGMRSSPDIEHALLWERWITPIVCFTNVLFYHFSVRYNSMRVRNWLIPSLYIICFVSIPLATTNLLHAGMQTKPYGYAPVFGPLMPFYILFVYGLTIIALRNFIKGYRTSSRAEIRNRSLYIIAGMVILLIGGIFDILPVMGLPLYPGSIIGTIIFCLLTTIAIVRHSLLDIHLVLRKGIAYVITTTLAALPFIGIFLLIIRAASGRDLSLWTYAILLIVLAAIMYPLWQVVQQRVDKWFYRNRYDFLQALSTFSRDTQSITDSSKLTTSMVNLLAGALQAKAIYLLEPTGDYSRFNTVFTTGTIDPKHTIQLNSKGSLVKWFEHSNELLSTQDIELVPQLQIIGDIEREALEQVNAELLVPLKTQDNKLSGLVILSRKLSQQPYTLEDKQLIHALAGQMAMKLENARLYRDVLQSKDKLETWLNSMTDYVMIIDSNYHVQFMNSSAIDSFGNKSGEFCWSVLGKSAPCSFCPQEAFPGKSKKKFHFTTATEKRAYDVAIATLPTSDGGFSLIEVLRDITEQRQAELEKRGIEQKAQLTSRLASVGEMASGIAHEINNPLVGVIGFAELLVEKKDLPEDIKEQLKIINNGAQRVASIVKRLLAFARQHEPERVYTNINEIIETTLELRTYALKTNNIKVTTQFQSDLPWTMADPGQIQQVFLNIIINAEAEMNLAHGKGNLLIRTETMDDIIQISFKDNGPGITRENLDKIFNPFFTTREVGEGTGLGLSMCHGIISEHNGHLYAKSSPGRGATFIVELPIIREDKQIESAAPAMDELERVVKARILIIDDELIVRQFLSKLLSDEGHEVESADNSDTALERLKNKDFDLVLADIKMPGTSGSEFFKHIQNMDRSLAKKVVFITGDTMAADTKAFLTKTNAPYITKPFETKNLKNKVNRLLTDSTRDRKT